MLKEEKEFLNRLKEEFKNNPDIADILIFGSAARTNFEKYNDIDVLVIFKNKPLDQRSYNIPYIKDYMPKFPHISDYLPKVPMPHVKDYLPYRLSDKLHLFQCSLQEYNNSHEILKNIRKDAISLEEVLV